MFCLFCFCEKTFYNLFFKIDTITLDPDPNLDLDPNRSKIHDPDSNSMYLDPQYIQ